MLLLGLDFETTGLAIPSIGITEIGAILWDTDLRAPVRVMGFLVNPSADAVWEPNVEAINGITHALCSKYGNAEDKSVQQVIRWAEAADALVAHNGLFFDKPVLEVRAKKYNLEIPDKLWIDTKTDLPLPSSFSRKLMYLATDHGFLNPFPHRAVSDVLTMMKILDNYNLEEVMALARSPNLVVRALIDFNQNDLAKRRGYHFQRDKKWWTLPIKACFLDKERSEAGFPIEVVN